MGGLTITLVGDFRKFDTAPCGTRMDRGCCAVNCKRCNGSIAGGVCVARGSTAGLLRRSLLVCTGVMGG